MSAVPRAPAVIFDSASRLLRAFNYEAHIAQSTLTRIMERHPALGVPPAALLLLVFWALYWVIYVLLLGLLVLTLPTLLFRSPPR